MDSREQRWEDFKKELMAEDVKREVNSAPQPVEQEDSYQLPPSYMPPPPVHEPGAVYRHKGLLFTSYWQEMPSHEASWGDVLIIRPPGEVHILRRVGRVPGALEPPMWAYLRGREHRRLCVYGYIMRNAIEHIASMVRAGRAAIVAKCDRIYLKPPTREELFIMWQREGHLVNISPARLAVVYLDGSRPRFAPKYKGCPVYSHYVNQIIQLLGLAARLTC